MDTTNLQSQKGFTLVEIAIVLVIIGLLLGGVLKGQELIENTKIKAVKGDADAISSAIYGYQDRYRSLPGDDDNAITNLGLTAAEATALEVTNGNGNGRIETANGENQALFAHLRSAGFVSGSGDDFPTSAFGGELRVETNAQGIQICQTGLNNEQMRAVDVRFDDGATNTNALVTTTVTAPVADGTSGPNATGSIIYTLAVDAVADDATTVGVDETVAGTSGTLCIQY